MLAAIFPIYGMIGLGWFARKVEWIKPEADSSIMKIAIELTLPCFIMANLLDNKRLENIGFAFSTISIGMLGLLVGLLVSWFFAKLIGLKVGDGLRTFVVTVGAQNYGFFLIGLVAFSFANGGGDMIGIMITHNVGCDLVFWSLGFLLISNSKNISLDFLKRGPMWSVFLSLVLIWTGLSAYVPDCVRTFFKFTGSVAIPLNLMIFGTLLYDMLGKDGFSVKILSTALLVRMFILPAMFLSAAVLLPIDHSLKVLLVLQALAPCGVTAAVLTKHFGGYPKIAVQITLATLVIAIFTLPIWIKIGLAFIEN